MDMEFYFRLVWSGLAIALLLAIAAIPLAYGRAGRTLWLVHTCLALCVGLGVAIASHVMLFQYLVPWWQTGVGYLAEFTIPALVTGWVARAAARRWPSQSRWRIGATGLAALLVSISAGIWVGSLTLPVLVNAVK